MKEYKNTYFETVIINMTKEIELPKFCEHKAWNKIKDIISKGK